MKIGRRNMEKCHQYPDRYKLCSSHTCVQVDKACPCQQNEYQCSDGLCIQESQVCNGINDCVNGQDELKCNTITESGEVSVSIVISISALSIGLCILSVILVLVYVKRKYRRTSESVEEPLRGRRSPVEDNYEEKDSKSQTNVNNTKPQNMLTNNQGYNLIQNMDNIGDFGQGMLCASTPKQGARQFQRLDRTYSGNISRPVSSNNTNLPDLLMNLSYSGNGKRKVTNETALQNIPYIDSSQEIIDLHR